MNNSVVTIGSVYTIRNKRSHSVRNKLVFLFLSFFHSKILLNFRQYRTV